MRSRQLPAGRGLLQIYLCFCNAEKGSLATGGAENFPFHSLHHRVLKFAKRGRQLFSGFTYLLRVTLRFCQMDNKKSSKSFSDLLLSLAAGGRLVFSFESSGQVGPKMKMEYYDIFFFLFFFVNNKFMRIKLYRCIITQ